MKHFFLFIFLLSMGSPGRTQNPSVDATFNPRDKGFGSGDGFDGFVKDAAVQRDGKTIVGGDFYTYNGTMKPYLLRLNRDGSLDKEFGPEMGVDNQVTTIAIQANGRILIGGFFAGYNGVPRNNIARLTRDGELDASFDPGNGTDGLITSIAVQPDHKILIGGYFTTYDGQNRNYVARLNPNGTLDKTFRPALGNDPGSYVSDLVLQPDGRIVLAGYFVNPEGTMITKIIRLNRDGSHDRTFSPKSHTDDLVQTLALQKDGRILIGGSLAVYHFPDRNHIIRLNADGSVDDSFLNIPAADLVSLVNQIIVQEDGHILVGGSFTRYNGRVRNRINRLNEDGSTDTHFNAGSAADGEIRVMTRGTDGSVLIGGDFTSYDGKAAVKFTRLDRDGQLDQSFNRPTGAGSTISGMAVQRNDKIIIGGSFTSYSGVPRNFIARLNRNGSPDLSFDPGTGANSPVTAVAVQKDNKVLIGGYFTEFNGIGRNHIARLNTDGTLDQSFNCNPDFPVSCFAIQKDGKIVIGGSFTTVNGAARHRIARLNPDGTIDPTFNPGTGANGGVDAICIQPNGKLLIGGYFTTYDGSTRSRIARLNSDGSLDNGFSPATGFLGGNISSIVLQPDGALVIAGYLFPYDIPDYNLIVRLNSDGSYDESFDTGMGANGPVQTMALQNNGKLVLGGYFTSFNGEARNYLVRLNQNGSPDPTFTTEPGAGDYINTLLLPDDTSILIGGAFTNYAGIGRNRIARLISADNTQATSKNALAGKSTSPAITTSNKLMIYPVPATHTLYVSNPSGIKLNVVIADNLGKQVYQATVQNTQHSIDVSRWINGLYHLVATDLSGQQKFTWRFIKQSR